MLEIGNKTITVDGVTVFADHADPNQFWYLPGPVQLARRAKDNRAAFTFIKYGDVSGDTIQGRGFLMVEVNLRLDINVERKIMSKISAMAEDQPKLAAVPFDEGTVQCIALDLQGGGGTTATVTAEGTFQAVENILGATIPSLHGHNSAAFSLSLSAEGATILEQVFKEKGTPVGALYNLKYSGLRPALDVEIKANLKRVYEHFSAGLEAQVYFIKAGIDAGFEKLVEDGVIEIKVINFSTESDRSSKEDWALNFFKEKLLDQWFRPTLTPGQLAGGMAQAENLNAVQTRGRSLRPPTPPTPPPLPEEPPESGSTDSTTPTQPDVPRPDENTGAPQPEAVITNPPVTEGNALNAIQSVTGMPPQTAVPPTPTVPGAGTNTPNPSNLAIDAALVSFKLKFIKQIEDKSLTFKFTRSEAVQRTYAPQGFFGLFAEDLSKAGHFFEIDGDDAFFREFRISVETPFDKAQIGLSSAHVMLTYGKDSEPDKKHKDFVIDKESPEKIDWMIKRTPGLDQYNYAVQYHFDPDSEWKGDESSYDFPPTPTKDRTLLLHPFEFLFFLDVVISTSLIDWNTVADVELHLSYTATDGWNEKETFFFSKDNAEEKHWKVRSSEIENKAYTYRIKYRMKDGNAFETDAITTETTQIAIGNPLKAINIEFIPLYPPGSVKTVFIDIVYEDTENDLKIKERLKLDKTVTDSVNFVLNVIDDTKGTYSYQTTIVGNDNTLKRNPVIETKETLIGIKLT